MKKILSIIVLAAAMAAFTHAKAQEELKKVYNDEINPIEQIDNALAQAGTEGKFVVCQVGGNWCPWCLRFAAFITADADISKLIADNFVYIHVNYDPRANKKDPQKAEVAEKMLKKSVTPNVSASLYLLSLTPPAKYCTSRIPAFWKKARATAKKKSSASSRTGRRLL